MTIEDKERTWNNREFILHIVIKEKIMYFTYNMFTNVVQGKSPE